VRSIHYSPSVIVFKELIFTDTGCLTIRIKIFLSCLLCEDVARDSFDEDEEEEEHEKVVGEEAEPIRNRELLIEKYRVSYNAVIDSSLL